MINSIVTLAKTKPDHGQSATESGGRGVRIFQLTLPKSVITCSFTEYFKTKAAATGISVGFSKASYRRYVPKSSDRRDLAMGNPWTPLFASRLIANSPRLMENQKQKGRPPKEDKVAKRNHFSVWVTKDQKVQINQLIEKSGLSASEFFLTLALNTPFKRPQKKTLPKQTAETIRILEQLAGVLSLAVLKTRDYDMISKQWQKSSQHVRLLAQLITLWVFEEFEIRTTSKTLSDIRDWMQELHIYLSHILPPSENKTSALEKTSKLYHSSKDLLEKYERYYESEESQELMVWKQRQQSDPGKVHYQIENAIDELLKRIKR